MSDAVYKAKLAAMRLLEMAPDSVGSVSSLASQTRWVPTYDDGPTPERTPHILEELAKRNATATFFVLATSVRANPGLLREVVAAGHEIGLHGLDHQHLSLLRPDQVRENLRRGKEQVEDVLGERIHWFRPPYGDQTVAAWREINALNMTSVLWSSTSHDWNPFVDNDTRVEKATRALNPGAIVLFHDGFAAHADCADDGPEPILDRGDLTARVLDAGTERGLTARSLGDALAAGDRLVSRPHFNVLPAKVNARRIEAGRAATYAKAREMGLV